VYLLDTNVISELRRQRPHGAVVAWLEATADEDLHLSAVTLASCRPASRSPESKLRRRPPRSSPGSTKVGQTWNVLPVDGRIFRTWAKLMHRRPDHLLADALIAATARVITCGGHAERARLRDFRSGYSRSFPVFLTPSA